MEILYKNKRLESILIAVNALAAATVTATFVLLFGGFEKPLLPRTILYTLQFVLLFVFIAEKMLRLFNTVSKTAFLRANWYEIPLLLSLSIALFGAGRWFASTELESSIVQHFAVGVYLVIQVVTKVCRTTIDLAATGRNPTRTLMASFVVLIVSGAGLLMLPAATRSPDNISFVDALFTSASATCVTGLTVKDIGHDFTVMGQVVIVTLIQLGGLGIVIFGAVLALLLGQAFSVRESVAMQDLLNANTLSRIGNMIAFIFIGTMLIETVGAVVLYWMWDDVPALAGMHNQWFCSIFHSISAFCNAGFGLFTKNLMGYNRCWQIYAGICPLIILGGLGFGVLFDIFNFITDRSKRLFTRCFINKSPFSVGSPKKLRLQTKVVLSVSAALIILGALAILFFESCTGRVDPGQKVGILDAFFQSVTARTAGFNTIDIGSMSASSKFILILLMFIGGSPGSTAGGIKTVTLAVIVMTAVAALRRRSEVEIFKRSVRIVVVGRAVTVTLFFTAVLFASTLALSVTENSSGFPMIDIMFEAASALGTVGLSTGITDSLTMVGKLIIIIEMLIGRLGPLTLLAALTFNVKPASYNYPDESIIVG